MAQTPLLIFLWMGGILVLLLLLSALISGSEIAFFSITGNELDQLSASKKRRERNIARLLHHPKRLLATVLILNNFVNVGIVTLSTFLSWKIFEDSSKASLIVGLTFVVTFVIVFFGEIVPKIYASQQHLSFARFTSTLILFGSRLVSPLSWILVNMTAIVEKRIEQRGYSGSIEEVNQALEMTTQTGISEEEKGILKGIVNFATISVTQIMRSRLDIEAVDVSEHFHGLMDKVNKVGYSRMPAFDETLDNIEGILYVKDLLPYIDEDESFDWQNLLRQPYFVPETKKIDDLLKDFQEKRVHIAIVVDEYGGTSGLITMEDILEEIVGDISDEYDEEEKAYEQIDEHTYDFEGKTSINDVCKILKEDSSVFDEIRGESESIGGMILEVSSKLPDTGEVLRFNGYVFTVISVDSRRIKKVRISTK